jgi:hypothetical protein
LPFKRNLQRYIVGMPLAREPDGLAMVGAVQVESSLTGSF